MTTQTPSAVLAPLVLVVDDVELMRELLSLQLGRAGCRFEAANDGVSALDALHKRPFDLVLMDRAMPFMNGCEATQAWRAHEQKLGLTPIPIIGVGGQPDDMADCLAAGMQEFVAKPLTIAALDVLLKRYLDYARA
ncbi:response regulator [Massilia sp. S19_KUP03_FR1]|uniref:response regulator n=1 Tax=Massilia sp. S19_KUP03_FR1 TaxID=3025503 RepID=UPI002FCD58E9